MRKLEAREAWTTMNLKDIRLGHLLCNPDNRVTCATSKQCSRVKQMGTYFLEQSLTDGDLVLEKLSGKLAHERKAEQAYNQCRKITVFYEDSNHK